VAAGRRGLANRGFDFVQRKDRADVRAKHPLGHQLMDAAEAVYKKKSKSYRRFFGVLPDIISKENKQDGDDHLDYDRYRPGSSGITVCDARVDPCGSAKANGASENVDNGSQRFYSPNRPEEDNAESEHHRAEKPKIRVQEQCSGHSLL
jgi:hypothetical protein